MNKITLENTLKYTVAYNAVALSHRDAMLQRKSGSYRRVMSLRGVHANYTINFKSVLLRNQDGIKPRF